LVAGWPYLRRHFSDQFFDIDDTFFYCKKNTTGESDTV
jgi:hypothetical protein